MIIFRQLWCCLRTGHANSVWATRRGVFLRCRDCGAVYLNPKGLQ